MPDHEEMQRVFYQGYRNHHGWLSASGLRKVADGILDEAESLTIKGAMALLAAAAKLIVEALPDSEPQLAHFEVDRDGDGTVYVTLDKVTRRKGRAVQGADIIELLWQAHPDADHPRPDELVRRVFELFPDRLVPPGLTEIERDCHYTLDIS